MTKLDPMCITMSSFDATSCVSLKYLWTKSSKEMRAGRPKSATTSRKIAHSWCRQRPVSMLEMEVLELPSSLVEIDHSQNGCDQVQDG